MQFSKIIIYTFLLTIAVGLGSCQSFKRISQKRLSPYSTNLGVKYKIVHPNKEKSKLILTTKANTYRLILKAYPESEVKSIIYEETFAVNEGSQKQKSFNVPVKLNNYFLEIILTNLGTNEIFKDLVEVDKNKDSEQTIMINQSNGSPFIHSFANKKSQFSVRHTNPKIKKFYVRYYNESFKAAHAPYVKSNRLFSPQKGRSVITPIGKDQVFQINNRGLYFIQTDTLSNDGVFLNCFDGDFPKLTTAEDLVESTRYITKNSEYIVLNTAIKKKIALDDFWLKRGKTKQRTKDLISIYYNRVQNANEYFTSYKEGWKTDRGIIYIIFGEPERVQKTYNQEYWYYSVTPRRDSNAEFYFIKKDGQYILQRKPVMEYLWKSQMYEWRKGLIRE